MKRLFLPFLFIYILLSPEATYAGDGKEFIDRYKNCSLVDGSVVFSKVYEFKNEDSRQLLERAKIYFDRRVQTNTLSKNTSDQSYNALKTLNQTADSITNSLILTERYDRIVISKSPLKQYATMEYVYRMDVKDEKIRISIICSRYWCVGNWYMIRDFYPYNERIKKFSLKIFDQFAEYVNDVLVHFDKNFSNPSFLDADW